jgi:selT/selW/selH-like putative selenoprotein
LAAAIKKAPSLRDVEVELVPGRRGSFEITRDGQLVYSKLATGRFPTSNDEVIREL